MMTPAIAFDKFFDEMLERTGWSEGGEEVAQVFGERLATEGDEVRRLVADALYFGIAMVGMDLARARGAAVGTATAVDARAPGTAVGRKPVPPDMTVTVAPYERPTGEVFGVGMEVHPV